MLLYLIVFCFTHVFFALFGLWCNQVNNTTHTMTETGLRMKLDLNQSVLNHNILVQKQHLEKYNLHINPFVFRH